MKKTVSLRLSLFRNLAAGPILLGLTLFAISLFTTRQLLKTFAAEITGRIIAETETAFAEYLRPVQEIVELSLYLGKQGRFASGKPEDLDPVFTALLDTVHQVSSVHVAKSSGKSYMLLRNAHGSYYNRLFSPSEPGFIRTREWSGKAELATGPVAKQVPSDYDPRKRVWFQDALARFESTPDLDPVKMAVWSDPYIFFTTHEPGITTSVAYRTSSGDTEVLGFDILLSDILEFARTSRPQSSGIIFILLRHPGEDDLEVLALPSEKLTGIRNVDLSEFPIPVSMLSGAPRAFVDAAFGNSSPVENKPIRFQADGMTWWGAAALSPLSEDMNIWIVATVPEFELLAGIPKTSQIILAVLVVTVALMVLRARRLARRYGQPIGQLVVQTERIGRLNFARETVIESSIHEVQTLASSQDTMRRSLSALSAMNDRDAIARELRTLPTAMLGKQAGRWVVGLWDKPSSSGGGCFPMMFAACRSNDGAWTLATESGREGVLMVLASTHLHGMRAAQHAPALRATTRALLRLATRPEPLLHSIREELVEGATATAPVALLAAFLDGSRDVLEIARDGRFAVLRWKTATQSATWLGDEAAGSGGGTELATLALAPEDRVIIAPVSVFDVLDPQRHRLQPPHLEAMLRRHVSEPAEQLARHLGLAIEHFAQGSPIDVDLALFVIAPAEGSHPDRDRLDVPNSAH